jgi:site-specific recombinase XerD
MDKVTPHSLRHAFASHAVDDDADVLVVKAIMGHAQLRTTEMYLHPSRETLRKAVNDHLSNDILVKLRVSHRGVLRVNHHRVSSG